MDKHPDAIKEITTGDVNKLVEDLHVHQIEVEIQNEELRRAQSELEVSRDGYSDLYDFAPVGYVTISEKGLILQANLSCAAMLGIERSSLIRKPFSRFIAKDDQDVFYLHQKKLFETKAKQICELKLIRKDRTQFYAQLESIVVKDAKGSIPQTRTTITDINDRKLAEEALRKAYEELERRVEARTVELVEANKELKTEMEDRKRAEKALHKSQERYMLAVSGSIDGIWDWDILSKTVFYSDRFKENLGYASEEFPETVDAFRSRLHPEDADAVWAAVERHLQEHVPYNIEYRLKTKSGEYRWFLAGGQAIWDDKGNATRMAGSIKNITERKQAEEALSKSQQIIEGIINAIPVRVFWKDKNLVFLGCNSLFAQDAGFADPKDIIGKDDYQMVWRDQAELYRGDDRQVIKSGTSKLLIEEPQTTPEGNTITLLTSKIPLRSPTGEIIGVLGTYMDITERKQAEVSLRASEEKYRLLVKNIKSIVYKGYKDWSVEFFDNKIELIVGYTADEFNSKRMKWNDIIVEEDIETARESFVKALKTDKSYVREYRINSKTGDIQWIQERGYIVCDNKGEIDSVSGVFFNITDLKQAEEALRISRENLLEEHNKRKILSKRLIDLLEKDRHDIAMELHDNIGQILTSLKINLEILDDKLKPMDTELGSLIKVAEKRASQAITGIKNIAHGLMPHIINALGLVSSLRTLLDEFREHTDIKIKFFNRNVPKRFDQEKELAIYRIVQEALNNIIKHAKAKNVYVSLLKKGNVLFLSVEDDGVGFEQDKKMKISKGKGPLGLVIMRERAMQLDGELTIESEMGKGTHLLAQIPI